MIVDVDNKTEYVFIFNQGRDLLNLIENNKFHITWNTNEKLVSSRYKEFEAFVSY